MQGKAVRLVIEAAMCGILLGGGGGGGGYVECVKPRGVPGSSTGSGSSIGGILSKGKVAICGMEGKSPMEVIGLKIALRGAVEERLVQAQLEKQCGATAPSKQNMVTANSKGVDGFCAGREDIGGRDGEKGRENAGRDGTRRQIDSGESATSGVDASCGQAKSARGKRKVRQGSFEALGLSQDLVKGMSHAGYRFPTPVQRKVIPHVLAGRDVVAMARTGSGKTAAFLAPMACRLSLALARDIKTGGRRVSGVEGLVILPTRELSLQTFMFFKRYAKCTDLTACLIAGGGPIEAQFAALATNPKVAIATPGRLLQLLDEIPNFSLSGVEICVLDEADRLFEGNLAPVVRELMRRMDGTRVNQQRIRQTILISATMPTALAEFASTGLRKDHCLIRLDADRYFSPTLWAGFYYVTPGEKLPSLVFLLSQVIQGDAGPAWASHMTEEELTARLDGVGADKLSVKLVNRGRRCIVFCATRHSVELLVMVLVHLGISAEGVHGNMDQEHRTSALARFRNRKTSTLVVTDVAARGLDVPLLDAVINYDFPTTPKLFVHRGGRCGRAGAVGTLHSLVTPFELPYMIDTSTFLGRSVSVNPTPSPASTTVLERGDNFLIGTLPRARMQRHLDDISRCFDTDAALASLAATARRGFGLYAKTCPKASCSAYGRSKDLLAARIPSGSTHVWFRDCEHVEGHGAWGEMRELRELVSAWEPQENDNESLATNWQRELWEVAAPMRVSVEQHRWKEVLEGRGLLMSHVAVPGEIRGQNEIFTRGQNEIFKGFESAPMVKRARLVEVERTKFTDILGHVATHGSSEDRNGIRDLCVGETQQYGMSRMEKELWSGGTGEFVEIENMLDLEPDGDQELAAKLRWRKKVWDIKKRKYVHEDCVNPAQARELRVKRNEAGERIRKTKTGEGAHGRGEGGLVYRRWAASTSLRVQHKGEIESTNIVGKAAGRAVVRLRSGGGVCGLERSEASLIAGPKIFDSGIINTRDANIKTEKSVAGLSDREKSRKMRSKRMKKKLALRRNGGVRVMPLKMARAMQSRATNVRSMKGLRVGPAIGTATALDLQVRKMCEGNKKRIRKARQKKKS